MFPDPRSVADDREPDPDRPPRRAVRRRTRPRGGRRHRPRARTPRCRGARVRGPLPAPGRAAGRRTGRGRQPDLRRARLGLPARHRRLRLQPRRADLQVQLPRRRRRGAAGQGRARRVPLDAAGTARRVHLRPAVRRPAPGQPGGAVRRGDPPAGQERAVRRRTAPSPPWACPATELPQWDDLQFVTAQLHRFPLLDDEAGRHGGDDRPDRRPAAVPRHPDVRVRHELRRAVGGGEDRARARRRAGGHRDLLRRGRHAARGAGRELPLLLRAGVGPVRLGRDAPRPGAGVPLQARPGRQDRHRRAPARPRRWWAGSPRCAGLPEGTPAVSPARFPDWTTLLDARALRRPGPRAVRRHPGRGQDVGPAHRGGPRRRAGPRRRLRDPRRPRRRHRRRADDLPRHTSACRRSPRSPAPAATSTWRARATSRSSRPAASAARTTWPRRSRWAPTRSPSPTSALQAIGCVGMRACHTDNCPMGIATQKPHLRARLPVAAGRRAARPASSARSPS